MKQNGFFPMRTTSDNIVRSEFNCYAIKFIKYAAWKLIIWVILSLDTQPSAADLLKLVISKPYQNMWLLS